MFVAEGAEIVRTGIEAGHLPESVYVAADGLGPQGVPAVGDVVERAEHEGVRVVVLAPGVMEKVADTVTPQPLLAVFPMVDTALGDVLGVPLGDVLGVPLGEAPGTARGLVVMMADVRDPGNAGTVLRTADAAGARAVVCTAGTVDPYNPKTVRSSAGSIFHVPLVVAPDPVAILGHLGVAGYRRLGAAVRGGQDYAAVDWTVPIALVLGNETSGIPAELPLDGTVSIPMPGRAESLNVSMACAVLVFEALRQRRSERPSREAASPGV